MRTAEFVALYSADRRVGDVSPAVKIEAGAKSALDPNEPLSVRPDVAGELAGFDLTVPGVTTVDPGRTFWRRF